MNSISNISFTAPSYVNAQCLKLGFPFEIHPNMLGAPQTNLNLYPKLDASNFHIKNHKKSIEINSLSYFFEYPIKFNSHHIPIFTTISPCSLWKIHQILNPSSVSGVESAQPWWLVGLRCH